MLLKETATRLMDYLREEMVTLTVTPEEGEEKRPTEDFAQRIEMVYFVKQGLHFIPGT